MNILNMKTYYNGFVAFELSKQLLYTPKYELSQI